MDTSYTQIHDLSFSLVITGTSIKKSGGVNQRLRKPKRQSSMCNPETLATLAHMTQDEDNPETLAHMTQNEDKQDTKIQYRKLKS
jgi:hypothetical protein